MHFPCTRHCLGTRRGRRYQQSIVQLPRGEKTKKKEFRKKRVHPDAQKAYEDKFEQVPELDRESITIR